MQLSLKETYDVHISQGRKTNNSSNNYTGLILSRQNPRNCSHQH